MLVIGYAGRYLAGYAQPPLEFDVGPSTGSYLEGFTESEERVPVTFRWTRESARVTLPVAGTGTDAVLKLRFARFLNGNANVRLFVDGEEQATFTAHSGRFRTEELPISLGSEHLTISFLIDDPDPERLGIALDWLSIENTRWRISRSSPRPALLLAGVFLLALTLGFSPAAATGLGAIIALVQAAWFARDPFAMVHVHDQLTVVGLGSAALVAFGCLVSQRARYLPLLFLLGYLLKGAVLFHPSYWYPDVRLHRRYVEVFDTAQGSLVERGIEAQKKTNTAYPRRLAGQNYVLPYSPLFYVPFTFLDRDARGLESIMKHVGLLLAAAEVLIVYGLASYLLGTRVAFAASLLALFLPPLMSRLLFAQWPTLFGHVLDMGVIALAAHLLKHPRKSTLWYAVAAFPSCIGYISSLFNTTVFTGCFALYERRRLTKLVLIGAAAALSTVLLLYFPFTRLFVNEIVPAIAAGAPTAGSEATGAAGTLARIYLFFGFGFPAFAIAGLVLTHRDPPAFKTLASYGATFLGLLALRALSGAFKDLKELVFVGPLIAITVGVSLEALAARGDSGRFAAAAVGVGLIGFGLVKFGEYAQLHTKLAGLD